MSWITEPCPSCGSTPEDGSGGRSFVEYEPAPTEIQEEEFEWTDELHHLSGFVCTECGYVIAVVDAQDEARHRQANEFRVDEELR